VTDGHPIFFTETEDGTWLAASVTAPLFCVSDDTAAAAKAKAQRAIDFWAAHRNAKVEKRSEVTVTQFAPQRVENLSVLAEACA